MLFGLPDDEFIALGPWARIKQIVKADLPYLLFLGALTLFIVLVRCFW